MVADEYTKKMKKHIIPLLFFAFLMSSAIAGSGEMSLLAVKEGRDEGSAADLFLEIKPGRGRVFLETIPISKFDTQISTRFAKDIACDYLDTDCSRYDFFYTISAESPIVGGPSAGAAIAVLTVSVLEDIKIDQDMSITGTINSGAVIGPVGGLKEKIEAASETGINTVLIPKGERFDKEMNLTLDLSDYAEGLGVNLAEADDLTEALYYFTGIRFKGEAPELEISSDYEEAMEGIAKDLCTRTDSIQKDLKDAGQSYKSDDSLAEIEESAENFTAKAADAFEQGRYYTSASYCFGANVRYRALLIKERKEENIEEMKERIEYMDADLEDKEIRTITDLQTYMVVKERIKDASVSLDAAEEIKEEGGNYSLTLGYVEERLYSALTWKKFFDAEGKEFEFDKPALRESCIDKLSEAEERYNYANIYLPGTLEDTRKEIDFAYVDKDNEDYELCLFKASKAKAEADVILNILGVGEDNIEFVIENKLEAVRRVIAEQQEEDIFPILGYSYYEYSDSLKESDPFSSLLYAEYSLELSNLDMYFREQGREAVFDIPSVDLEKAALFAGGLFIGIIIGLAIKIKKAKTKRRKR